jgi:hypothetical protein
MFLKRNKKAKSSHKGQQATPPPLADDNDTVDNSVSGEDAVAADDTTQPTRDVSTSRKKGESSVSASSVENPRVLIAEAIGQQAVTLAKTNTVLKIGVLILGATTLATTLMAASVWHKETEYRYFFMDSNGTILENQPLSEPALSLNMVRDFYAESLSHLFSFHYRNFGMHYQRLAPNIMTERAMLDFSNEIDRIGLINSMEARREVAEAVITQTPVLISSGVDPATGVYTWELSVPFNLRLESGLSERHSIRRMDGVVRVHIVRVEPNVHPRRILINRITIRDTSND